MNKLSLSIIAVLLVSATTLVCREVWYHPNLLHIPSREVIIKQHLEQIDGLVIVGDSLVERNGIKELCGRPIVNAGIGRAKATDLIGVAELVKGRTAILAVGVNDNIAGHSLKRFKKDYKALVDILKPVAVVGITGSDRGAYNTFIRSTDAKYIEPLPEHLLYDGVHYSLEGSKVWHDRLQAVCP